MHGRVGYGCDVIKEYVEIARQRVQGLRAGTTKTRPMNKPVYDPQLPYGGHNPESDSAYVQGLFA